MMNMKKEVLKLILEKDGAEEWATVDYLSSAVKKDEETIKKIIEELKNDGLIEIRDFELDFPADFQVTEKGKKFLESD